MNSKTSGGYSAFSVFSVLWAAAALFHLVSYDQLSSSLPRLALTAAAVFVFMRPAATGRLALLAAIQVFEATAAMPTISNHWLFTTFVNLTILAAYCAEALRRKSFAINADDAYRTFAPAARIELLVLYFFVVFHKLNVDFFDPEISCGAFFYISHAERFTFLPQGVFYQALSLYATLIIEALIPLFLIFRRTRSLGIVTGMVFHTIIAFNPLSGFYNFSSMLFTMYALFAPQNAQFAEFFDRWQTRLSRALTAVRSKSFAAQAAIVCIFIAFAWITFASIDRSYRHGGDFVVIAWALYSVPLIAAAIATLPFGSRLLAEQPERLFSVRPMAILALPVLVFINGMSPYLGLKTETSFAMFSNLRTEDGVSNHFIMPASMQLFDYQRDMVEILHSTDPDLQALADADKLLPYFELRIQARRRPDASTTFIRSRDTVTALDYAEFPELSQLPPWYIRKLLYFRAVQKSGPQPCAH